MSTAVQIANVRRALGVFVLPDQVAELRALNVAGRRAISLASNDLDQLAAEAVRLDNLGATGVYFTINPLRPDLHGTSVSARKADVIRRCWLPLDVDPIREADTSSTNEERQAAWDVLRSCIGTLESAGLTCPVEADSANGFHAPYPIDLPNDNAAQELVKSVLVGLAKRCDTDRAKVDTRTFDAVRIWKLYGTKSRKGADTPERPHRYSRILSGNAWSADIAVANTERLQSLLAQWTWIDDTRKGRPAGDLLARARAYIAKEPPAISGQRGHDRTFHVACVLVKDFALNAEQAFEAIQEWNRTCQPPWSDAELRHKIESAIKAPGPVGKFVDSPEFETNASEPSAPDQEKPSNAGEPWTTPIPLNESGPVMPFPVEVFPAPLRQFAEECAWATNSPVDFAALPMLGLAAGAIGNARALAITRTHSQPACLFVAVVGLPGSGKSPCLDQVRDYMEQVERSHMDRWKEAVAEWEKEDQELQVPKPVLQRNLVDDTTTEKLVTILSENPRGLTMIRDELAALVSGMDQYKDGGKGSDRQSYLKIWSNSTIRVDRKSNLDGIPTCVRHPCLSIIGGVQPQVIEHFRGEVERGRQPPDDGFLDRFLVGHPAPLPAVGETWREVSEEASMHWSSALQALLDLSMAADAQDQPQALLVHLTPCGKLAWSRFTNRHADELNAETFPEHLRGPWAKLRGYCGRLALVLHYLRWVCGEVTDEDVDGESVERAARLVAYFKGHSLQLHAAMGRDPRVESARKILRWLDRKPELILFSRRDVLKELPSFQTPEAIEAPLRLLTEHDYLRRAPEAQRTIGRKPSPKYLVNPLYRSRNGQNGQN